MELGRSRFMLRLLAVTSFAGPCGLLAETTQEAKFSPEAGREFFESRVRPVLVEHCYSCHNSSTRKKGGLALDFRDGLLEGGGSGPVILPGQPEKSLLIRAVRHEGPDLHMPKDGPKLSEAVVSDLLEWIRRGAPDPRDAPPASKDLEALTSWETTLERRKAWWSFQPITSPPVPVLAATAPNGAAPNGTAPNGTAPNGTGSRPGPVDRFILQKLQERGLEPAPLAERRVQFRRLSFALTGLPPEPEAVEEFLTDKSPGAWQRQVDRLLESPHFGERWARHWMDLFRYADTHGSEGDPRIPHAWRYRDYLIRALNADIPYDQLVREHLAGDLLPPELTRIDTDAGINESAIGTAHLRFVEHGYAPVDALEELVRFTDNQIDVISKAFLGVTLSCARCHNHKFDPISQKDFYAMYGTLASCRPALVTVDLPERLATNREGLVRTKEVLRDKLAESWLGAVGSLAQAFETAPRPTPPRDPDEEKERDEARDEKSEEEKGPPTPWQIAVDEAKENPRSPLHAWVALQELDGERFRDAWDDGAREAEELRASEQRHRTMDYVRRWDFSRGEAHTDDYDEWFRHGAGLPSRPTGNGEFHILSGGAQVIAGLYPAGVYTHLLSTKHNGVLNSPRFKIETDNISVRILGRARARARLVVHNYPRVSGPIYKQNSRLDSESPQWKHWDTTYWVGEYAHIEVGTAGDLPVEAGDPKHRSWFGLLEIVFTGPDQPNPDDPPAPIFALLGDARPANPAELAELYVGALRGSVTAWKNGNASAEQVDLLGYFVRYRLLPNTLAERPGVAKVVAEYRRLEAEVPPPTRVPGVLESHGFDQPLFVRGNHQDPAEPVPRRFLEALGGQPYKTAQSGRLELANEILSADNPLTTRVFVNRLWHHLFGRGVVATTDNFGRLGRRPTHPELLDYLATRFVQEGWSIKKMLRLLATSDAFRRDSVASADAATVDPENLLWSHFPVRRLEAEAIRDSLLAISGDLDLSMYGAGVDGDSARRSVYVTIRRTKANPFLDTFDLPKPFTTRGRRDVTNVPAQSLTLLNDPLVLEKARRWAEGLLQKHPDQRPAERIHSMFRRALARSPTEVELEKALEYVEAIASDHGVATARIGDDPSIWQDFAQSLFNAKEFIYLR